MKAEVNNIRDSRNIRAFGAHEDIRSVPPAMTNANAIPKAALKVASVGREVERLTPSD
jgi:hypothetical protein